MNQMTNHELINKLLEFPGKPPVEFHVQLEGQYLICKVEGVYVGNGGTLVIYGSRDEEKSE